MFNVHGGGGGNTLIFSYIRRLRSFFGGGGQNFEFHYYFGIFREINIFLRYEDFVDIFWGVITKFDYI